MAGNYLSTFKGKGLEFKDFRQYSPSDDASRIDWKASLRAHKLLVRELIEERNLSVIFLIDVSESMLFGSTEKLKAEYAIEVVATLSFAIQSVGDMVGIIMFSNKIIELILPSLRRSQFSKIVNVISDPYLYGGGYNLVYVLEFLMGIKALQKNEVVFIVSDFIGLKGDWKAAIKTVAQKFDLNAIIIRDPVEQDLPGVTENIVLLDPFEDKRLLIDPKRIKGSYKVASERKLRELKKELLKTNSGFMTMLTNKPYIDEIIGFFKQRGRR